MLSPAWNVTVSDGLISSSVVPSTTPEPVAPDVAFQPELLIALAMSPAVASASALAGASTLPSVVAKGVVFAVSWPFSTLMVLPSVFTFTSYARIRLVSSMVGVTVTALSAAADTVVSHALTVYSF